MIAISDPVWIAIIAAGVQIAALVAGIWKVQSSIDTVHKQFNSRMDEYLALAKSASRAEGVKEGEDSKKAKTDAAA